MRFLGKYWKVLLSVIILLAAIVIYVNGYQSEKILHESRIQQTNLMIQSLQNTVAENNRYTDVQDELEGATERINASRLDLYEKFPVEMKEEDQIMYVLYLEKLFGTEIFFSFGTPAPICILQDGSELVGLLLTVNYETTYDGFQNMVSYLSSDSRITSVQSATIEYDAANDKAVGQLSLVLYMVNTDLNEYEKPDVADPGTGKENIFE